MGLRSLLISICASISVPALAETWRPSNAQPFEGSLSGVFGSIAVVTGSGGTDLIPLDKLDDAGLGRIADYLESSPNAAAPWAGSKGKVSTALKHRLQILKDGRLAAFDPGTRPEPVVYLVYFGAHWCPPCRAFSPALLETYRRLKAQSAVDFEVIFVSNDHDADEQLAYVQGLGMPWPVLKYNELGSAPAVERWEGPGIPDLVVLTRDATPIFNSYHGADYVGPQSVLDAVEPLLTALDETSAACRWSRHRLSVLQYIRGAHGGSKAPSPYMMGIDPARYQALPTRQIMAVLTIDEHGLVTDAKADPQLPTAQEYIFEQDARSWLFLPSVSAGKAKSIRVKLPINF